MDPFTRLYGSAVVAVELPGQRRVPFLPAEKVATLRDRRVRRIVRHAARHVPYYRDLFQREGIDPREIRGADDLAQLPITDRGLVRSQPGLFVAATRAGRSALTFTTSGSTGAPARVSHDRRSLLANVPFGERERAAIVRACGGSPRPKELYVGNETSVMRRVTAFYEESTFLPVRPRRRFVSVRDPIEAIAALTLTERPDLLVGYGGWVDLFFKTVVARGIDFHRPKLVMYMAEALPPGGRDHIEGTLGIPVMSRYSAAEAFKIAYFCEQRTGFHLHEDLCHVRVLAPDGSPAVDGVPGELVISNLVNRATVLLNYPIGDVGSVSEGRCPCGRTSRQLSELEGRVEDILPLADGRFVHPRAVWQVFMNDPDVLQYQLTQHGPRRFELKLAAVDRPAYERLRARSVPKLEALLGPGADIDVAHREASDHHGEGKFRAVASLRGRPPAEELTR